MSKSPADQGTLGCSRSCYWVPESPCWVSLIAAHTVWLFNNSKPLGNLTHACHSLLWSQLSLWSIIWNPDKSLNVAKLIEYSGKEQSRGDDTLQLSHLRGSLYSEKHWQWGWFQFSIFSSKEPNSGTHFPAWLKWSINFDDPESSPSNSYLVLCGVNEAIAWSRTQMVRLRHLLVPGKEE